MRWVFGSLAPPNRYATRAIVENRIAFPFAPNLVAGRHSGWVFSGLMCLQLPVNALPPTSRWANVSLGAMADRFITMGKTRTSYYLPAFTGLLGCPLARV